MKIAGICNDNNNNIRIVLISLMLHVFVDSMAAAPADASLLCSLFDNSVSTVVPTCPSADKRSQFQHCMRLFENEGSTSVSAVKCLENMDVGYKNQKRPELLAQLSHKLKRVELSHDPLRVLDGFAVYDSELILGKRLVQHGDVALDIGGHVGGWVFPLTDNSTAPFTALVFEPVPENFAELEHRLEERPDASNICIYQLAASNSSEVKKFWSFQPFQHVGALEEAPEAVYAISAHSSFVKRFGALKSLQMPETGLLPIDVIAFSIDELAAALCIPYVDFVKIDVEGHELSVIQGALWMLKHKRIGMVQFEYGGTFLEAGITLREIASILSSAGYSLFREVNNGTLAHISTWTPGEEDWLIHNFLAIDADALTPEWGPVKF